MVRGRKPKPTAVKEASGSFRHDPQRRNKYEPQPSKGRPVMPDWIADDPVALRVWNRTCELLESMGLLTEADFFSLDMFVFDVVQSDNLKRLIQKHGVVSDSKTGEKSSPYATQYHKFSESMRKFMSDYGFNASSRSRLITALVDEDQDIMAELIARMGHG